MGLNFDRRTFLMAGASVMVASVSELPPILVSQVLAGTKRMKPELAKVKACVFDLAEQTGA